MLNQIVLVGRLCKKPEIKENENGKRTYITLAVPRSFKNINGEYENDFFKCSLYDYIAESTVEYCDKGDIIGVKGRLQSRKQENGEYSMEIIAEKITFLTSNKNKMEEEII